METAELERLEAAATKARDAWSAKNDRLSEVRQELQDLQEKLEKDYGPEDAFLAFEASPKHSLFIHSLEIRRRVSEAQRELHDKLAKDRPWARGRLLAFEVGSCRWCRRAGGCRRPVQPLGLFGRGCLGSAAMAVQ